MAKYAIIENQTITNVIVWNGDTNNWSPPAGSIAVLLDTRSIGIGDRYIDEKFVKVDSFTTAEHWENLRSQRNLRLVESDWSQLPDVPVGIRTSYQTYRQELRDLPANTVDPRNIIWPEHPE